MLYPLQCYGEPAQWGIRWMLHQLSEDGQAFLPCEQLPQIFRHRKGVLWKVLDGNKRLLAFHSKPVGSCCSFSPSVLCSPPNPEPRLKKKKKQATASQNGFIWHNFNLINLATDMNWFVKRSYIMVHSTTNFLLPLRLPALYSLSLNVTRSGHSFWSLVSGSGRESNAHNLRNCNNAISLPNALLFVCLHHMETLEPEG